MEPAFPTPSFIQQIFVEQLILCHRYHITQDKLHNVAVMKTLPISLQPKTQLLKHIKSILSHLSKV